MFRKIFNLFKSFTPSKKNDYEHILKSVREFKNRPIYKELTNEIIDNTEDKKLLQIVFDSISEKVSWDDEALIEILMALNESRRAIFVIWCLDGQVNNGGFNQFYFNSTGRLANLIPPAMKLIGAIKLADLVNRANKTYEAENSIITYHQDGTLEGFSKSYEENPLNKFDSEYYNLCETENLEQLQINYVRINKIEFIDK
jgi:hypothetical protein